MDIVMGVSMAPENVRMVLVEGENADGVTVEEDTIPISTDGNNQDPATLTAPNQVVSAILGTRESATQGGYQVTSTGVTWTDPVEAAALRDLLAAHKMENVMLVSAFLSAAALTQTVGNAVGYDHTALLFVEPDTATLAVVDTADGSVTEVQRRPLPADDEAAVAALTEMVAGAEVLESEPDGLFVVGSDVDVAMIKPQLEAATSLVVNAPDEPEMALARGAALASAHAPLFESSTAAQAYAQVPGAGVVEPGAPAEATMAAPGYAAFVQGPADYDASEMTQALAYSADPDSAANAYTAVAGAEGVGLADAEEGDVGAEEQRPARKPFLVALSVLTVFVVGVAALAIALALDIRPKANDRPNLGQRMVVPTQQAPAPPQAPPPAPAPAAPAPAPAAPAPAAPAPAPAAPPALPAPPPVAPAPPPVAPPAAPVAPPQLPVPANPIPAPNVPGPGIPGPNIPGPPIPGIGHGGGGPGIPGIGGGGIPGIPHF